MRRVRTVLVALGVVTLGAPATAAAAVTVSLSGGTLTIVGSPGDDRIVLGSAGSNSLGPITSVRGGAEALQAGAGCAGFDGTVNGPPNAGEIWCPTNDIQRLALDLLDGDDEFDTGNREATVDGGPGDDEISIGGTGGDGVNTIDGGPGDDTIRVGRAGLGDDVSGGADDDTVDYTSHAAVNVTLDGTANDGTGAEGDNIRPDVERVVGTASNDTLIGSQGSDTLDGAGGTDRLEGLGDADTLIGGPGTLDATFGGEGDDAIMLRDGLVDACPSGGAGVNTFDLDLVDSFIRLGAGSAFPRCLLPRVSNLALIRANVQIGAVDEGPNVRMSAPAPALRRAGVRVRLGCPAVLRAPCAGSLRAFALRGTVAWGSVSYSLRPGRAAIVVVPLDPEAREAALRARALRVVSVEKGRSRLGPKTTILIAPTR